MARSYRHGYYGLRLALETLWTYGEKVFRLIWELFERGGVEIGVK
jgi:hypothetical protein